MSFEINIEEVITKRIFVTIKKEVEFVDHGSYPCDRCIADGNRDLCQALPECGSGYFREVSE